MRFSRYRRLAALIDNRILDQNVLLPYAKMGKMPTNISSQNSMPLNESQEKFSASAYLLSRGTL